MLKSGRLLRLVPSMNDCHIRRYTRVYKWNLSGPTELRYRVNLSEPELRRSTFQIECLEGGNVYSGWTGRESRVERMAHMLHHMCPLPLDAIHSLVCEGPSGGVGVNIELAVKTKAS